MVLACYVTRAHEHKDIDFLGEVGRALDARGRTGIRFVLTLTDAEWNVRSAELKAHAVNLGPLRVAQLPELYRRCDLSVFHLLKSFSATPLESLVCGTPLVAIDADYVSLLCGPAARYAPNGDPEKVANQIVATLEETHTTRIHVDAGLDLAHNWPSAQVRAQRYIELINNERLETTR